MHLAYRVSYQALSMPRLHAKFIIVSLIIISIGENPDA
jgi:hypothetical protein